MTNDDLQSHFKPLDRWKPFEKEKENKGKVRVKEKANEEKFFYLFTWEV